MQTMAAWPVRPRAAPILAPAPAVVPDAVELAYETLDWTPAEAGRLTDAIYEPYTLQSLRIAGAKPHPTPLVQSEAMASVAPPRPSYRPMLPARLLADGILSDAPLESGFLAGAAHGGQHQESWKDDPTWDNANRGADETD